MVDYKSIYNLYQKLTDKKPLILNLTNSVTQDFMANVLLALGAAPIMSASINEVSELVSISGAININIGTLTHEFINLASHAAAEANARNKCVILDPVGAGASKLRTATAIDLARNADIIRGNPSEIMSLIQTGILTKGVESSYHSQDAIESAKLLALGNKKVIAISGRTDYIVSADTLEEVSYGDELMTRVTGMGCSLGAVIAAFAAVEENYFLATCVAITFYTLVAMSARLRADKPAKFKIEFIDGLFAPDWKFIQDTLSKGK